MVPVVNCFSGRILNVVPTAGNEINYGYLLKCIVSIVLVGTVNLIQTWFHMVPVVNCFSGRILNVVPTAGNEINYGYQFILICGHLTTWPCTGI